VPRQYIASVETGVRDVLTTGPLGFPMVDVAVNLPDGCDHAVGSSDMAVQMAARIAMKDGLAACHPVLLEPIMRVVVETPSEATAKVTGIVSQRRGQIPGFDARPGWHGWDVVEATIPQAAIGDLIVELRSATAGVASFRATFDQMAEPSGRLADIAMSTAQGKAA
jgi:elongation factor G